MSKKELKTLDKWLKEKLEKGWIRKSTSLAALLVMFVPKTGSDEGRLVVDFRRLNDITIKNRYLLPNIEEAIDRLVGAD